jgi:hypothetical protein
MMYMASIEMVSPSERLFAHEVLRPFTELYDAEDDGLEAEQMSSVGAMIEGDVAVTGAFEAQKRRLSDAYALAHEYRKTFEPLRDTCLQDAMMDIAAIRQDAEEGRVQLPYFNQELITYKTQLIQMHQLPAVGAIDILHIDTADLKRSFVPYPQDCLDKLHHLLPQLAAKRYAHS